MAKFCSNCGATLNVNAKFCPACGQKISMEESFAQTSASSKPTPTPPVLIDSDAILLHSAAPIPDKRPPWANQAYFIGGIGLIIGILYMIRSNNSVETSSTVSSICMIAFVLGILILVFAGTKDRNAVESQLDELRLMKFKFVPNVNFDDIYNKLQPALDKRYKGEVDFDRDEETISIIRKRTIYDIILEDDATFRIHWRKNLSNAVLSVWSERSLLKEIRTETAIISYELQQQFGVN